MILSWAIIGLVVGAVLGLTGAGGAVIAVPLFKQGIGAGIHQATTLSLIAVAVGALLNWIMVRNHTEYRAALPLYLFSILGSSAALPYKPELPTEFLELLFLVLCFLGLIGIWRKPRDAEELVQSANAPSYFKIAVSGFVFGVLVTLTGLGGGVLLIPMLKALFNFTLQKAIATSLFLILLSSSTSLLIQWSQVRDLATPIATTALIFGNILAAIAVRFLIARISQQKAEWIRKTLLTVVILFSCAHAAFSLLSSVGT